MAENGQTAVAWEMLSNVVVLRAKARENKLPKLLSSLHGVEVELARIIADSDVAKDKVVAVNGSACAGRLATVSGQRGEGFSEIQGLELEPDTTFKSRTSRRTGGGRGDQQLRTQARKYLAIARQLGELVHHGEAVATGAHDAEPPEQDFEATSDSLLAEQHDLAFSIASLKAATLEGLGDKAAVLDDLIEENSDDPVQILARSLVRDVIAMSKSRK